MRSVQALTGHVEGQRLVGQRLAHAQVGRYVDQVAGTRHQVQYGLRLDVVGTVGSSASYYHIVTYRLCQDPPLLPLPAGHPLEVSVLHHPLGHKVHAVVGKVHHAAIALRQVEHYDAVAASKFSLKEGSNI